MEKLVRERLFEAPEERDIKRVEDLFHKSKGSDEKLLQLTRAMAKSITDIDKAQRRAEAAWQLIGKENNPIADIFLAKVEELKSGGKEIGDGKPVKSGISFGSIDKPLPTKNPEPDYDNLSITYDSGHTNKMKGVIYLPTYSAIALWDWEITGQLSDGAWENASPEDHWRFWSDLLPRLGIPEVRSRGYAKKTGYNLAGLIEYVGDRMVQYGRFGKAVGEDILTMGSEVRTLVEDFLEDGPFDLVEWKNAMIAKSPHRNKDYYWKGLTQKHIDAYYSTKYDMRDMRKDLSMIKTAMKNISR